MIILGIDPGTAITGYGIVKVTKKGELKYISSGYIATSSNLIPGARLKEINKNVGRLIKNFKPQVVAIEKLFFFKNLKTAIPVSQSQGVIILTATNYKIPVKEFTPLQIKMALTGYGKADKQQIQRMVKTTLNLKKIPKPDDVADALATAICCAFSLDKYSQKVKIE